MTKVRRLNPLFRLPGAGCAAEDLQQPRHLHGAVVALPHPFLRPRCKRPAQARVGEALQRPRQLVGAARLDRLTRVADQLRDRADPRGDDGQPGGHRLEDGPGDRVRPGRQGEGVGRGVEVAQLLRAPFDAAMDANRSGVLDLVSGDHVEDGVELGALETASISSPSPFRSTSLPTKRTRSGPCRSAGRFAAASPHQAASIPG